VIPAPSGSRGAAVGLDSVRENFEGACGASTHPWQHHRRVPCSSADPEPHIPELLKAALKVVVVVEQPLEGRRTAETGEALQTTCTHIEVWTVTPLLTDPGRELLLPLPRHVFDDVVGLEGSA
jgi:hypothetical protein